MPDLPRFVLESNGGLRMKPPAPRRLPWLRRQPLQSSLDEFVFRFNRRQTPHAAFRTLLGIGLQIQTVTDKELISPEAKG